MSGLYIDSPIKMQDFDLEQPESPDLSTPTVLPNGNILYDVYLDYIDLTVKFVLAVSEYSYIGTHVTMTGVLVERVEARDVTEAGWIGQATAAMKKCRDLTSQLRDLQQRYDKVRDELLAAKRTAPPAKTGIMDLIRSLFTK